jgi:NAD(P)-dependent dehydrogenase (short-subunit alcohol dehydrogenase family)
MIIMFLLLFLSISLLIHVAKSDITQQVVVVTGASTGIGKSIVLEFAQSNDFKVYATMRNPMAWEHPKQDNIIVTKLDVTSDEDVSSVVKSILEVEGKIDILVNNAGYAVAGCLESVYIDEAKAMFDVNVWGVVRMLQAGILSHHTCSLLVLHLSAMNTIVLPSMRRRRAGYVINTSSTAGIRGFAGGEYYVGKSSSNELISLPHRIHSTGSVIGSKFALEGITESMRYSLAAYNISVTNINAGPVKTPIGDKLLSAEGFGSRPVEDADDDGYILKTAVALQQRLGQ